MPHYTFSISDSALFVFQEDMPDDACAWDQAIRTVRDVETSLSESGGRWLLLVSRDGVPIYRIEVHASRMD